MKEHSPRFLALVESVRPTVKETSVHEVRERLSRGEPFHLIDVREDHEWRDGRIPGAAHLGRGVLERDIERQIPDLDSDVVLYCGGGYRSALAAASLQAMGYRRVLSMAGGFSAWRDAGLPEKAG
jgi:rhodanese-related sulfurtransferase